MFDLKAYIGSGVLEAYVSGMLNEAEASDVEAHRTAYPEVDAEIKAIEAAMKQYAEMNAPHLPSRLKQDIWDKVNKKEEPLGKIVALNSHKSYSGYYRLVAAAAIAGLLISLGANYYLYDQWKYTQYELASAKNEKGVLAQDLKTSRASYQLATNQLGIVKNPHNKAIKMTGLEIAPTAWAVVYWDSSAGKTFIDPADLPVPPAGKQYQLWAIADGKPVDAGVFNVDSTKPVIQPVKDIKEAQMFAVTLEPIGGSPSPTLASMYVAAKLL